MVFPISSFQDPTTNNPTVNMASFVKINESMQHFKFCRSQNVRKEGKQSKQKTQIVLSRSFTILLGDTYIIKEQLEVYWTAGHRTFCGGNIFCMQDSFVVYLRRLVTKLLLFVFLVLFPYIYIINFDQIPLCDSFFLPLLLIQFEWVSIFTTSPSCCFHPQTMPSSCPLLLGLDST